MTDTAKAQALAEKIARKAADALDPIQREMDIMGWPNEFRTIMWGAVAHHAAILAHETGAKSTQQKKITNDRK